MDQINKQFQKLKQAFRGKILLQEPLARHTTFRIGGPADYYVYPRDLEDLSAMIDLCQREDMSRFIIGNGSNLLVSDQGYHGVVIDLSDTFSHIRSKGDLVTVGSGAQLFELLKFCIERGLSGIEALTGIPGQVGGAIWLNAGAFGSEMCDHIFSVRLLDRCGTLEKRRKEEFNAGYRQTDLPSDAIVVEAQFLLREGNPKEMEALQRAYLQERKAKQPLSLPSAGSVFKRPQGDFAGRLIEEVGCKGLRVGDAMVSKKHANFIVNCHFASASDVLRLIAEVRERVFKRFDVELKLEIHLVGFANG